MQKHNDKNEIGKSIAPYLNLGLQMAITIVAFVLLGWWLDNKFSASPLFILICAIIGIAIAMFNFIRVALKK